MGLSRESLSTLSRIEITVYNNRFILQGVVKAYYNLKVCTSLISSLIRSLTKASTSPSRARVRLRFVRDFAFSVKR